VFIGSQFMLANVVPRVLSFTGAKGLLAMFADHHGWLWVSVYPRWEELS